MYFWGIYFLKCNYLKVVLASQQNWKQSTEIFRHISLPHTCEVSLIVNMHANVLSHSVVYNSFPPHGLWPARLLCSRDSAGKNTGVGCHFLLHRIFPTQGLNQGLPHCRQILYHLSHQGSPRILKWIAYPFTRGSSQPRNRTGVSCIAGRFFTSWATRKAPNDIYQSLYIT